jgi:hypothetical protein
MMKEYPYYYGAGICEQPLLFAAKTAGGAV